LIISCSQGVRHDQHEQPSGDDREDDQLGREGLHVPLLDRVVERALPGVEPDLPACVGADDDDDPGCQQPEPVPVPRGLQRTREGRELGDHTVATGSGRRL
jgi:hypothetical protein